MLLRIVVVLTLISAFGGLIRVVMLSRGKTEPAVADPGVLFRKRKQRLRGSILFLVSTFALLFLITGYLTPIETIFAFALCLAAMYPLTFIKGELRMVQPQHGFVGTAAARDAVTGELLGPVVEQLKEPRSDLVRGYKIRTNDGIVIEKSTNEVVIELKG